MKFFNKTIFWIIRNNFRVLFHWLWFPCQLMVSFTHTHVRTFFLRLFINISFIWDAGNPRVTPEVTRDVCLLARMMAANLYYSQIEDLMFEVLNICILLSSLTNFISLFKVLLLVCSLCTIYC